MGSDVHPEPGPRGTRTPPDRGPVRERCESSHLVALSRQLRLASADFRSLALHAGPMHRLTIDARRRVEHFSAMLHAETEKRHAGEAPEPA